MVHFLVLFPCSSVEWFLYLLWPLVQSRESTLVVIVVIIEGGADKSLLILHKVKGI